MKQKTEHYEAAIRHIYKVVCNPLVRNIGFPLIIGDLSIDYTKESSDIIKRMIKIYKEEKIKRNVMFADSCFIDFSYIQCIENAVVERFMKSRKSKYIEKLGIDLALREFGI